MKSLPALAFAAGLVACGSLHAQPEGSVVTNIGTPKAQTIAAPTQRTWKLRWSDDFIGPAGVSPDPHFWTLEQGNHGFGAEELQAYTARPQNVSLSGRGELIITALREDYEGLAYTSGRIHTRDKVEFRYGAIEIRAKLPSGHGIGAAAWTGGFGKGVSWPRCGERDIWEVFGGDATRIVSSLIGPSKLDLSVPAGQSESYYFPEGQNVSGWHIYRHEFTPAGGLDEPEEMRFYVDGQLYRRARPDWFGGEWVFNQQNHFLVFNIAIGGERPWGLPDISTEFPVRMIIDYVRLYDPS